MIAPLERSTSLEGGDGIRTCDRPAPGCALQSRGCRRLDACRRRPLQPAAPPCSESCGPPLRPRTVRRRGDRRGAHGTIARRGRERYGVLIRERVQADPGETERLVAAPIRAVFARGINEGLFRQDLTAQVLLELFGGALIAASKLNERGHLGLEEASAATASVFLDGARAR